MPRQEIRHLSGSGPRPARPSVRIGDCTARAGNGRKRTIPGHRAGHWRRGQLQDLSRGRRPPAPGRAGAAKAAPTRRRSTGSLRRKSSRALESAIGPEGKVPFVLANLRLLFGERISDAVPLGGRAPFRGLEPQIASTDAANSLYLQPISPRSTIACCRG